MCHKERSHGAFLHSRQIAHPQVSDGEMKIMDIQTGATENRIIPMSFGKPMLYSQFQQGQFARAKDS